jgi:hypothetical protein
VAEPDRAQVRLAELVAALSLGIDPEEKLAPAQARVA